MKVFSFGGISSFTDANHFTVGDKEHHFKDKKIFGKIVWEKTFFVYKSKSDTFHFARLNLFQRIKLCLDKKLDHKMDHETSKEVVWKALAKREIVQGNLPTNKKFRTVLEEILKDKKNHKKLRDPIALSSLTQIDTVEQLRSVVVSALRYRSYRRDEELMKILHKIASQPGDRVDLVEEMVKTYQVEIPKVETNNQLTIHDERKTNPLCAAVKQQNVKIVEYFFQQEACFTRKVSCEVGGATRFFPLLYLAFVAKNKQIVDIFTKAGAIPAKNEQIVDALGSSGRYYPFDLAIMASSSMEIIQEQYHDEIDGKKALKMAVEQNRPDIVRFLVGKNNNLTNRNSRITNNDVLGLEGVADTVFVKKHSVEILQHLCAQFTQEQKADLFESAITNGHLEAIRWFVKEQQLDVNEKLPGTSRKGMDSVFFGGGTRLSAEQWPLNSAVSAKTVEPLTLLLALRADKNIPTEKPLEQAKACKRKCSEDIRRGMDWRTTDLQRYEEMIQILEKA